MATYVFSDVHGHVAPLERMLERISPSADDRIFMLGDMIDRGPDPVGVMRLCRDLPNACVLMGNHEDLMLTFFADYHSELKEYNWVSNGGWATSEGLSRLDEAERIDLINWVEELPLAAHTRVGERPYLMVHAGIIARDVSVPEVWSDEALAQALDAQLPDNLLWVRQEFWGSPTGLINDKGEGPIVIAGHTPTVYLKTIAKDLDREPLNADGLCHMVKLGACEATGNVADRWDIDCGCAGGQGFGQLLMLRLDDGMEFYERIHEGE